jgi:hypothetical protein
MIAVYGNETLFLVRMKFWSKQFRWGRASIQDDPISGRLVETRTENMVEDIDDLLLSDRQMKLAFIARVIGVLETIVWKVVHDDLGMKKMSACWIPRHLTPEQKLVRKEISQKDLIALQADDSFFHKLLPVMRLWCIVGIVLSNNNRCMGLQKLVSFQHSRRPKHQGNHFLGRGRNSAY